MSVEVKDADELAEGANAKKAADLLVELATKKGDSVLCTHGDLIPEVLRRLHRDGCRLESDLQFAKGSTWELSVNDGGAIVSGRYQPPPAGRRRRPLRGRRRGGREQGCEHVDELLEVGRQLHPLEGGEHLPGLVELVGAGEHGGQVDPGLDVAGIELDGLSEEPDAAGDQVAPIGLQPPPRTTKRPNRKKPWGSSGLARV